MYIFYFCILAPLLQTSFSLNEEEIDLNLLSSNYDGVDTIGENIENIEPDESGIVVFDTISAPLLEKLCKHSNTLVYITQEDITIDCEAFNKGDQPVEQSHGIIKRSADLEEGSGMPDTEEETTIKTEEATTLSEETTVKAEEEATMLPTEEEEATTLPAEEEATTLPKEEEEVTTLAQEEEKATTIPEEDEEATTLAKEEDEVTTMSEDVEATTLLNEEVTTMQETTVAPVSRRAFALNVEGVALDATNDAKTEQNAKEEITPQENGGEKEVEVTTIQLEIAEEENKAKPDINEEDNKDNTPPSEEKEDIHEPKEDAEVVNNKTVISLHTNQENKEATNDEPDIPPPKESTENTKKAGSKDTTILIVLFAAVVIVGALAFGYNYVKKRRQQSADLERVERGSTLKRSLQNLTKLEAAEPEKKPLIGDSKEVEMIDMKKASLVENSEKPSNEQVVKT